jgi:outer membrane protein insertion porin family
MTITIRAICLAGAIASCGSFGSAVAEPAGTEDLDPAVLAAAPVGEFGLGVGYGTETGAAFTAHASAQGLRNEGHQVSFRFKLGEDSGSAGLDYRYGPLGGREDLSFGLKLSGFKTRPSKTFDFATDALTVKPRLIYRPSADTLVSPFLSFSSGRVYDVPTGSSALITKDAGQRQMQSVGVEIQSVLGGVEPVWPSLFVGNAELGRSNHGQVFSRLSFDLQHDRHFGSEGQYELSMAFSAGRTLSMAGSSHLGDRTILGQSSLRGFDVGGFGPRDLAAPGQPALGGNSFATVRFEARMPGLFGGSGKAVPGLFVDAASLWGLDDTAGGPVGADAVDDALHIRASVGLSLDYRSDFGTFQLSIAHPIKQMDYDRIAPLNFSFSKGF